MPEQPRPGEQGKVEQLEILDLENHRGLYGRLLMASQAQETEVANILNPATPVEFNLPVDKVPLEKRDYNPVFKNLSFNERQDQWKNVPVFNDAYNQWRTQFTGFMTGIKDSRQEEALRIIMSNSKMKAAEFTEGNADTLFKEFCTGKSDITNFLQKVTANLARTSDGKIDPANLKPLLFHLEWIASGLFGRKTAGMSARLVDLESQLHNNHTEVLKAFALDKEKIKTLEPDDRKALGALYNLIPLEERTPVKVVVTPPPPASPLEDEDEIPRAVSVQSSGSTGKLDIPPPPPPPTETSVVSSATAPEPPPVAETTGNTTGLANLGGAGEDIVSNMYQDMLDRLLTGRPLVGEVNLRTFDYALRQAHNAGQIKTIDDIKQLADTFITPPAAATHIETNPIAGIKEIKVEGDPDDGLMSLEINGKDTGLHWYRQEANGKRFYITGPNLILRGYLETVPEYLELPEGLAAKFYIHHYVTNDNQNRYMGIMGGKDARIGLKGDFSFDLIIFTNDFFVAQDRTLVDGWVEKAKGKEGQAIEMDHSGNFLSGWVETKNVLRHLEKSFQIPDQSLSPVSAERLESAVAAEKGQLAKIEVILVEERPSGRIVKLNIAGEESGIVWRQWKSGKNLEEGKFFGESLTNVQGTLKIPNGTRFIIDDFLSNRSVHITGGENTEINISRLQKLRDIEARLLYFSFTTNEWKNWEHESNEYEPESGQSNFTNLKGETTKGVSVEQAFNLFEQSLEPTAPQPASPAARTDRLSERPFTTIHLKGEDDLAKKLNDQLRQNPTDHVAFSVPSEVLKKYLIATIEGSKIEGGDISKVDNENQITIKNLRITKAGIGVTLDLVINNSIDGIAAKITKFHRDLAARTFKASSREEVEKKIKTINAILKEELNKQIATTNPNWKSGTTSIRGNRVLITFNKTA